MSEAAATRYGVTREALGTLLADHPRYRVDQLWSGLYERLAAPAELTDLPKALRAQLDDVLPLALEAVAESTSDGGETVKWLWALPDGTQVETVLMHYAERSTVCVGAS